MQPNTVESILERLDQRDVSKRARVETRSREDHLPPIGVYRWWARRTETVSGAVIEAAEAVDPSKRRMLIADPFAGGGVIPLAALKRGHALYAQDLNPWVVKGLTTMLSLPERPALTRAGEELMARVSGVALEAYGTSFGDGSPARIAHTLRVASSRCVQCGTDRKHFPHALVSLLARKETRRKEAFLACPAGHICKGPSDRTSSCEHCGRTIDPTAQYLPKRIATCPTCGSRDELGATMLAGHPTTWSIALVDRSDGRRREIAEPTGAEVEQADSTSWRPKRRLGAICGSHETRVLSRHGFENWEDLYPPRQRRVLEAVMDEIRDLPTDPDSRAALTLAAAGTAEMAGHLSRWDRFYLKSYESMASHRFNFTTLTAEPNVIGGAVHGRGSLSRRLAAFAAAASWCSGHGIRGRTRTANVRGDATPPDVDGGATVVLGSSERMLLPSRSVDLVLTDPPYHDDVQYHELSLPLRAWAGLDLDRAAGEAVAVPGCGGAGHYETLCGIFSEVKRVLKPEGRLVFSYANREPGAWLDLFRALNAAGLRPVAYTILHGEDENGFGRRGARSCNLDIMLELTAAGDAAIEQWRPSAVFGTDEERYLAVAGDAFLDLSVPQNTAAALLADLKSQTFLREVRGRKHGRATSGAPHQPHQAATIHTAQAPSRV